MKVNDELFLDWLESELCILQSNIVYSDENASFIEMLDALSEKVRGLLSLNQKVGE